MKKQFLISLFLCLISSWLFSQTTITGKVTDEEDGEALISASIAIYKKSTEYVIKNEDIITGTATDVNGYFELNVENVDEVVTLIVSYTGYESYRQDIVLSGFNELNITLRPSSGFPVVFIAELPISYTALNNYYLAKAPAAYDDPARALTQKLPLLSINDQGNNFAVRGNSPNGLKWYLNGVEIPNPNHTPNAGTAQDRITYSGGGVNMLKPEFIEYSEFNYTGYSNALGGVISNRIGQGFRVADDTSVYAFKIGLIGLEGMVHHQKDKINLFVSGRYSTVGLLTNGLGVDFGGEKISFWDYNFNLGIETANGELELFSVYGASQNRFEAQRDSAQWEIQKDRFDIDFYSQTTISGVSYLHGFNNNGQLYSTLALSSWNTSRQGWLLDDGFNRILLESDSLQHHRISGHFRYKKNNLTAQLNVTNLNYHLESFDSLSNYRLAGTWQGWLYEPQIQYDFTFLDQRWTPSFRMMYFSQNQTVAILPALETSIPIPFTEKVLYVEYAMQSQLQNPEVYLSQNQDGAFINQNLGFSKAHHFNLHYFFNGFRGIPGTFRFNLYYQYLFDIPIIDQSNSSFSTINDINSFIQDTLTNNGTGRNYGIELNYDYKNANDFFIRANGSWYQSKYIAGDGIERDTRFNGNFIANLVVGKEWTLQRSIRYFDGYDNANRRTGIYIRGFFAGGLRETPIDVDGSQQLGRTVYFENQAYSLSQGNIFRIDARLYWSKEKNDKGKNRKHTIALDIQNLTNQQNIAFRYFDVLQGEVITKNQLGLIPLLSWKVEF